MTLGRLWGAVRDYLAHRDQESLERASGRQSLPRPAAPIQNKLGGTGAPGEGSVMAYMPPVLDQPSYFAPKDPERKVPRFAHLGQILVIGVTLALAGFLAALITAIVTYSAG